MLFNNSELIKIPNFISIFYLKKNKVVVFKFFNKLKFITLNFKINLLVFNNKLYLTKNCLIKDINIKSKIKTALVFIRFFLIEIQTEIYKKLNLIGVGYKIVEISKLKNKVLLFKFGLSHFIYFKINSSVSIFCSKFNQIFVLSNCFYKTKYVSAKIKKLKLPDVYQGKGLKFSNEQLFLKNGKNS